MTEEKAEQMLAFIADKFDANNLPKKRFDFLQTGLYQGSYARRFLLLSC